MTKNPSQSPKRESQEKKKDEKCPLCTETFPDCRSVLEHISKNHAASGSTPKCSTSKMADVKRRSQEIPNPYETPKRSDDPRMRNCFLCSSVFRHKKSLVAHLKKEHDLENDDDRIKSLPPSPKLPCSHCGTPVVNIYAHKNTCSARKKVASGTTDEDESPVKEAKLQHATGTASVSSEDEIIQKFCAYMASLKGGFAR